MSEKDRQPLSSFPSYDGDETTSNTFSMEQPAPAQWDRRELASKSKKSCKSNDSGLSEQEILVEGCHKMKDALDEHMSGLQNMLFDTEKLRESIRVAEGDNQRLQAEKEKMWKKIKHLEEEKKGLEGEKRQLEAENQRLGEENKRLESGKTRLEGENKRLVKENKRLYDETKLQEENKRLQAEITGLRKENNRLLTDLEGVMNSLMGVVELQDSKYKTVKCETIAIVQYLSEQYGFTLQGGDKFPIVCTDEKQEDTPTHNGNEQTLQEATVMHTDSKTEYQPTVPMKLDRATQSDQEVQSTHSNSKKCASEMGSPKLPAIPHQNTSHKPPSSNDAFRPTSNEFLPPLSPDSIQMKAKGTKKGAREKTTTEIYSQRLLSPVNNRLPPSK